MLDPLSLKTLDEGNLGRELTERLGKKRTVVCGVGNELRGDDGVGMVITGELAGEKLRGDIRVLQCGEVPENFLQDIVEHNPGCVVILDAVDAGKPTGSIVFVESDEIVSDTISTHRLPLSFLSRVIESRLDHDVDIFVIGIQIENYGFGEEMTPAVVRSAGALRASLSGVLS
jgi:hydrogenase 3 maturation protease